MLCNDKLFSVPDMPSFPATSTTEMEKLQRCAVWNVMVPKYSCTRGKREGGLRAMTVMPVYNIKSDEWSCPPKY